MLLHQLQPKKFGNKQTTEDSQNKNWRRMKNLGCLIFQTTQITFTTPGKKTHV